jgi:hypothetical protein
MKRLCVVSIVALIVTLVAALPAGAITYGEPDNGRHPNVGMMLAQTEEGYFQFCSGTLIDERVFLTAAHCEPGATIRGHEVLAVYVTFSDTYDLLDVEPPIFIDPASVAPLFVGEFIGHPEFGSPQSSPADIAVIILEESPGIEPAELPGAGLLDELKASHELRDQLFTNVGYGALEREIGGGPIGFGEAFRRMLSTSSFNALTKEWLRLSQNPATGDGGTCFGDSGGPQFLGGPESNLLSSITITGDATCRATNVTYRLDSDEAREFLGQFVELPD